MWAIPLVLVVLGLVAIGISTVEHYDIQLLKMAGLSDVIRNMCTNFV